jgi:hypothetical protein
MSSLSKFSARVILIAGLCCAPFAFGQGGFNAAMTNSRSSVISRTLLSGSGFFVHAPDTKEKHSCAGESRGHKHCQPVPEGGAAAMYLLLAGLSCFGAVVLRSRRHKNAGRTA